MRIYVDGDFDSDAGIDGISIGTGIPFFSFEVACCQ